MLHPFDGPHPMAWPWRFKNMPMTANAPEPQNLRCKVLRAKFLIDGRLVEIGEIVELPVPDARRLEAAGHVEILDA